MTNTIPNVPRELLENLIEQHITAHGCTTETARQAQLMLSAPSPAGVDGMEVVGWYTEDYLDDKSATTYSREVADRWLAKGWPVNGIANAADAQAIIDGLRGDVAKINSDRLACWAEFKVMTRACLDAEKERDQQAQRIGELEGLLYEASGELRTDRHHGLRPRIDAALSAGKEAE